MAALLTTSKNKTSARPCPVPMSLWYGMDDSRMRDGCRRALHFRRMVRVLCPATLFQKHFLRNGTRFASHFRRTVWISVPPRFWGRIPDAEFLTNGMHFRPYFWRTVAIFGFPMASAMATFDFPPNGLHFPPRMYPPVGLAGNVSKWYVFRHFCTQFGLAIASQRIS